ncbi:MAG: SRPBCC family protein [Chloroflexota bacterium]|nr:SRPBCC family protein [Chloroflexota bacterium]
MRLHINKTITIPAPASKVWHVLAHEFGTVSRWASSIPRSHAVTAQHPVTGGEVGGRMCATAVPGFDAVQERFTSYDEAAMRFAYTATAGRPVWITRAENNWAVRARGVDACVVEARAELEVPAFPGMVLAPFLKLQMGRVAARLFEELKYVVEHDRPHPRKLWAQTRARVKLPVRSEVDAREGFRS